MSEKSNEKKYKMLRKILKILLCILIILLICFAIIYFMIISKIEKINKVYINEEELGIANEVEEKLSGYTNIAIFGLDSRKDDYGKGNRSDCIIIVSINNDTKEVKLISLYRDTYVDIEGYGLDKITHAYSYGEAELALKTINRNLDLNISEFITVNFESVAEVIDQLGGVEVEIDKEEIKYINNYITATSQATGKTAKYITETGLHNLEGVQAVAYSRIRYTEGGDYKRTERMREVIEAIANKAKTKSLAELNQIVDKLLPKVLTNIKSSFILKMIPNIRNYTISNSMGWPYEIQGITLENWYGIPVTLESNVIKLHQEIFEQIDYVPSETVKTINNKIIKKTGYK